MTTPDTTAPLASDQLRRSCDLSGIEFEDSSALEDPESLLGQERALAALDVGLGIDHPGYNLYALGPCGLGKHGVVQRTIEPLAAKQPAPDDWCYVNNFDDPARPRALALPAGQARRFATEMERLVEDLRTAITSALDSEEFSARRDAITEGVKEQGDSRLEDLRERAEAHEIALINTPAGWASLRCATESCSSPTNSKS